MILSFTKIIFQYLIINFAVIKAGIKLPEGAGTKTASGRKIIFLWYEVPAING